MTTKLEQDFETWWEREGQEFLFALNTTTDDDIKLVAEVAWKNGAYCAEQAEQKPVAIGSEWKPCMKLPVVVHVREQREGESHVSTREGITPVRPDDLIMRGVAGEEYPIGRELFNKTYTFDTAAPVQQTEQEPVAWGMKASNGAFFTITPEEHDNNGEGLHNIPLYTRPVRTKDLTDDEVAKAYMECTGGDIIARCRAVIAKDREKNR